MTRLFLISLTMLVLLFFPMMKVSAQVDLLPNPCDSTDPDVASEDYFGPIEGYTAGWSKTEGMFVYYTDAATRRVLVSVTQEQLGHEFFLSETLSQGTGNGMFAAPMMFGQRIFELNRDGNNIEFSWPNYQVSTVPGEPMARAVEAGISDEIFGRVPIEAEDPVTGRLVFDLSTFLLAAEEIQAYAMYYGSEFVLDYEGSYVSNINGYPLNDEIDTRLVLYGTTDFIGNATTGAHEIGIHFSLSEPPPPGYTPRLSDDRVGYFVDLHLDYSAASDSADTRYVRYINRWRLEKADPSAEISDPVQPIVFWIENTVPYEYREAVRDGILFWTSAFESAGFSNAIVAKQMPDDADWDPADIRYNTIRWFVSPTELYAIGPCRTDPRTGEIFDADIGVNADMLRGPFQELEITVLPLTDAFSSSFPPGWPNLDFRQIRQGESTDGISTLRALPETIRSGYDPYSQARSFELARSIDILRMCDRIDEGSPEEEEFIHDYLTSLIAHEVGHTLGLRHNFAGSSGTSFWSLNNANWTRQHGLSQSIMDYTVTNISPNSELQGQYFQTEPGDYDYWSIQYGYTQVNAETPEEVETVLDEIASRAPLYRYGTDEDYYGWSRNPDPDLELWDLSGNPVQYYGSRMMVSQQLLDNMLEYWDEPGTRPTKIRRAFVYALWDYVMAANIVPRNIGGVRMYRDHVGDPDGHQALVPLSAEEQRRSLEFLKTRIWSSDPFEFEPELLNMLVPDRDATFDYYSLATGPLDFDIHEWVLYAQAAPFYWIYDPTVLQRVLNNEVRMPDGGEPFTLVELFDTVRNAIWLEVDAGTSIDSYRRNLQRAHLEMIAGIVLDAAPGTPQDAVTLARRDLIVLRDSITALFENPTALDEITIAHLDECLSKINVTLEAPMLRYR